MQATAVVVGMIAGRHARPGPAARPLPASETTLARPSAGLFLAGRRAAGHRHAQLRAVLSRLHPLPAGAGPAAGACSGPSTPGTSWPPSRSCAIGAYLTALLPKLTPVAAVGKISGKWALIIMALSLVNANTFNAYTGSFQILAFGSMWRRFKAESVTVRVIPFLCVMAAGVVIACLGYQQFVSNLSNFLDDLLVLFIPWSAVNLADYFLVRHGNYDVASFFTADGQYGKFAWRGLLAYADRPGRGMAVRLPARLHRAAGQDARRRRHLLAGRLVHRRPRLPAPDRPSAPSTARHDRPIATTAR